MIRDTIKRGSDKVFPFTYVDAAGSPTAITDATIGFLDVSTNLVGRLTATKTNAAGGEFQVFVEGTDPIPLGNHRFRVQITWADDSPSTGSEIIELTVV